MASVERGKAMRDFDRDLVTSDYWTAAGLALAAVIVVALGFAVRLGWL